MRDISAITDAVIEGDNRATARLTQEALDRGVPPLRIYQEGLIPGMDVVGDKFKTGEYYLPELILAAKAMKKAEEILKPVLASNQSQKPIGKVVMGTVKGDLHDIGKNLVIMLLEGAGFAVTDLGVDVPSERFLAAVQELKPDVLGLSALLTVTMLEMNAVLEHLEEAGCRDAVKVMIGGAAASQQFADEIGADGFGRDAADAVALVRKWVAAKDWNR